MMAATRYVPQISVFEAYERTLTVTRTLHALPDSERRFLAAGGKVAWPKYLHDFADYVGQAEQDEIERKNGDYVEPREPFKPSRAQVADVLVAGKWFASLALLPENVEEFRHSVARFIRGKCRAPRVDDQRIIEMHARGATLRTIGSNLRGGKLNEFQTEARIRSVAESLCRIANGRARLIHIGDGTQGNRCAVGNLGQGR